LVVAVAVVCSGCPDPGNETSPGHAMLNIPDVFQQTSEWCWLASAQMILQHYNVPPVNGISYQCGIMGAITGPSSQCFYDCSQCVFGSGSDAESAAVLSQYTQIIQQYYYPQVRVPQVSGSLVESEVPPEEIAAQLDAGHPIELGITPSGPFQGQAQHAVVVVGYDATTPGQFEMVINDPFPYNETFGAGMNPYYLLGAPQGPEGTYTLEYGAVAQGLQWSATIVTGAY
jgi:hypothetical protein